MQITINILPEGSDGFGTDAVDPGRPLLEEACPHGTHNPDCPDCWADWEAAMEGGC